ncbi:hypothetical protein Tco_1491721 [Tanacetum coccineum]
MALALMAKSFTLNDTTPTNNNQRSSSNPNNIQIAQPGMNIDQDRQMLMVEDNVGNQFRQNEVQNVRNQAVLNAVQNPGVQNVRNQNRLSVVPRIANQHGNGNVIAARAEGNSNGINRNQIRCYNCRGEGQYASNCTQASTSGTQSDKAPVYDSDGLAEVYHSENCYDNDKFNMFTQEEEYTKLLEPIPEPRQIQQNDSNIISTVSSVEQSGRTVEQHPANVEETRVLYDSLYNNLAIEVEKVNLVNRNSAKQITTLNEEIANLNNQLSKEKSTVSSLQEEKKKLKSDFKIREDELLDKQIQLENKIKELDNILVKTGQSIQTMQMLSPKPDSFYHTEQKMALGYQNPFYLKQAQQKQQSLYNGKVLLGKHDTPAVYDSEETLELAQEKAAKFVRDFKSLTKEADKSLTKHKALELEIERLLRAVVSEQKDITKGTSVNTKFANQSTERKPSLQPLRNNFVVRKPNAFQYERLKFSKTRVPQKVDETNDLSNTVTSNSVPTPQESKVMKNDNVIALGMFRINPFKAYRVNNFVLDKHVKASVRTKPITISQPHVITKNDVNSKTNGFSHTYVKSTTRTRRPQPRNNLKNDKKCLITTNHDVCVLNYVNDMNSRALNKKAHVSNIENQKKHMPKVWKPKKVGSKERLALPKTSTHRSCLRWSPTGRLFDLKGKIIATSEFECQSDCFKGDNACTSNPQEPISKRFPNSTFSMTSGQNWFDTLLILLLSEYKPKDREDHGDNECDS